MFKTGKLFFTWLCMALLIIFSHAVMATEQSASENAVYDQALELANQGQIDEAIDLLAKHLAENPKDIGSRLLFADLHDFDGKPLDAIRIMNEGLSGSEADLDLLWSMGGLHDRLGDEGPTVTRKRGAITYHPNKDEKLTEAFKTEHARLAAETYEKARAIDPDITAFTYKLALAYSRINRLEEAAGLLEQLIKMHPEEAAFVSDYARVLSMQGKGGSAKEAFEKVLALDPSSPAANRSLAEYYEKEGDKEKAESYSQRAEFYDWLPTFSEIAFSKENYGTYLLLKGARTDDKMPEEEFRKKRSEEIESLIRDGSKNSLEFLAALCWHHGDHGDFEKRAFKAIEEHGDVGAPLLLKLMESGESICTIRQASEALSRLRYPDAFEPMMALLPADVRPVFAMNIAEGLARYGDERAVPELIRMADVNYHQTEQEDDIMNMSGGRRWARYRAIVALGSFTGSSETVGKVLKEGLNNPQVSVACLAGLYRLTGKKEYKEQLSNKYVELDSMDRMYLIESIQGTDDKNLSALAAKLEADRKEVKEF